MKLRVCLSYALVLLFGLKINAQPPPADELSKYSFNYRNIIPGMPENASLGSYGNIPINTGKGLPNISFDLYTLSKGGVSVPISISYQASGIRYSDISSVVGMKWNLSAGGSINRSVNGIVDEDYLLNNLDRIDRDYMEYQNAHVNAHQVQDSSKRVAEQSIDVSLDNYFYDFPGHGGSMYLGPNKKFRADKEYEQLQISYTNHLDTFIIKDNAGNTYMFGNVADNSTIFNTGKYNRQALSSMSARVSWKLRKIITATKQEILFDYSFYYYEYSSLDAERWTEYSTPHGAPYSPCGLSYYYIGENEDAYQTTQFTNVACLLTKISTDDQEVLFGYRQDSLLPIFQKKLSSIKVYSKISADTVKKFVFTHDGDYLTSFTEVDKSGHTEGKKHSFMYYGYSPLHPFSKNRDFFGYYNSSSNSTLMANAAAFSYNYVWSMADRRPNRIGAMQGTLSDIIYPTGGKTSFDYEYNMTDNGSDTVYAPGLRIKSIRDEDITGKVYNEKKFHYSPLGGSGANYDEMTINNEDPAYLEPTMIGIFNSEDDYPFDRNNFGYAKVIIENTGNGTSQPWFEADHYGSQYELFQQSSPLLVKKEIFREDTFHLQQSVVYDYNLIPVDSVEIYSYLLRKPVPFLGNYAYDDTVGYYNFCTPGTVYQGYDLSYSLKPMLYQLDTMITKEFTPAGDSLVTIVSNTYGGYGQIQKTETKGSDGSTGQVIYSYPADYPANPVLAQMKDSFIVSPIVKEQYLVHPHVVKKTKENTYAFNSGGFFTISGQTITDQPTGKTQTLNYYGYNPKGQLLSAGRTGDVTKSYIWDYLDELPVAEAINADTLSIAYTSFEANGKGRWNFSGTAAADSTAVTGRKTYALSGGAITKSGLSSGQTYIISYWSKSGSLSVTGTQSGWPRSLATITRKGQSWTLYEHKITGQTSITLSGSIAIDELRLYPEKAQMTSYTYQPLVGITSQCDANGRIVYYDYDGLDRLSLVRDQYGNVVKKICYNYLGQPEDCRGALYWNRGGSTLFTKNDCDSGYTGTSVVYSIPAGIYSSTVSQAQADSIAAASYTAGQAYANTHGTCVAIYYNVLKSGSFTRNDCDSGYLASTLTYTVPAHTYSSLVSQAHADSLAQADVDANGQAFVNTHGICVMFCEDCTGRNKKCIDFVCDTGIKIYTSSEWDSEEGKYKCIYHYEFSDGSWSIDFFEYSNTECIID